MQNLSVVIPYNNKRVMESLLLETGSEISVDVKDNLLIFRDITQVNSNKFCGILAKVVSKEYEKILLVKAINIRCSTYSKSEKIEIWKIAMSHLYGDCCDLNEDYFDRINSIKESVYDCFLESSSLSLEGLVNFRLGRYLRLLEDLAEQSAREYKIDQEYKEFVLMLKYYISLQTPRFNHVHVFYGKNVLIFGDGENVTEQYIEEYKSEIGVVADNNDDFVLNSLLLIAPHKVKLTITDAIPEKEFINTLKGVFENKITINV